MKIKIFCRRSFFPSWSGYELISTPVTFLEVWSRFVWLTKFGHNDGRFSLELKKQW